MPSELHKVSDTVWELPRSYKRGMVVPARIYATEKLIRAMDDGVFDQVSNVACLPGILRYAFCMPDGHWGYGFPIGGVAAMDPKTGVISPGGIGFDINCGMRLVLTNLTYDEIKPRIHELVDRLFERVPCGVGSRGFIKLSHAEFRTVMAEGSRWALGKGYGWPEDLELTEEGGCFPGADPSKVSERAVERGFDQVGTLGSGNHYCEIQVAKPGNIFDGELAKGLGFTIPNQVVVMFHCGSRGFGHQVATDYLQVFLKVMESRYGIRVNDRELACAPFLSPEGQDYFAAMTCAINMAFANRQVILHRIREVFADTFKKDPLDLGMHMVYDVAHNTAKLENHRVGGVAEGGPGPPEGRHARLRPRPRRPPGTVSPDRAARHHRREHGDGFLPPGRTRKRRRDLLLHGPRQRPHHEPAQGETDGAGGQAAAGDGAAGHLCPKRHPLGTGGGGGRGVQKHR